MTLFVRTFTTTYHWANMELC